MPLEPETVARDLTCLVLALVELVHQLMERQALRRIDQGDLDDERIESLGLTLMALEQRIDELREHFDLTPDDLNIDLGPLGPLLAPDQPAANPAGTTRYTRGPAGPGHTPH
ncbi:gas vesicle protein K [Kitasatospora sp. NPDC008115]|uniref:gas vesicle protein K n=1 Tax=Kitasatospora sp. NPDC008115 TaxID=3364022 RepID=UPI0036E211C0